MVPPPSRLPCLLLLLLLLLPGRRVGPGPAQLLRLTLEAALGQRTHQEDSSAAAPPPAALAVLSAVLHLLPVKLQGPWGVLLALLLVRPVVRRGQTAQLQS